MPRYLAPLLLAGCVSAPAVISAHDLWVEPEAGGYQVLYGHHPQVSHEGARQIPYAADVVKSVVCLDAAGGRRPTKAGGSSPVKVEGDCAVLYVLTSSGYWSKTPTGTKNVRKTEATAPLGSWQSFESVKHIAQWGPGAANPLGTPLEIVAADNPLALKDVVTYDGKPRGQTGADGTVNIRVKHGGLQLLQASTRTPHAGPEADEVVHTTALTFTLGSGQ